MSRPASTRFYLKSPKYRHCKGKQLQDLMNLGLFFVIYKKEKGGYGYIAAIIFVFPPNLLLFLDYRQGNLAPVPL